MRERGGERERKRERERERERENLPMHICSNIFFVFDFFPSRFLFTVCVICNVQSIFCVKLIMSFEKDLPSNSDDVKKM